MSHGAGEHDWDHKLACVMRQRSTHISADAGASYPLAELLGKHDIHAQIEHLSYQIGGARNCELPNLQEGLQIIVLAIPSLTRMLPALGEMLVKPSSLSFPCATPALYAPPWDH